MPDRAHAALPCAVRLLPVALRRLVLPLLVVVSLPACWPSAAHADELAPDSCPRSGAAATQYLDADPQQLIGLLAPPPASGSAAEARELAAVLAAQRAARGTPRREQAVADSQGSCARLYDALGAQPGVAAAPALAFLDRAALQASAFASAAKRHFQRARPYVHAARVERLADVARDAPLPPGVAADYFTQRDHTSYPSGHGTLGAACAILMSAMVPERRVELFARGRQYGESRLVVGAHYPGDLEAGRITASVALAFMQRDTCFRADAAEAGRVLRAALALPPAP
jgi:acid phosphatase (class A)